MALTTYSRRRARGFTLIELTIVLAVVVTLALILTPSIANIINDARTARARSDCNTIANAIVQFYKDTGFFPQWLRSRDGGPGESIDKVLILTGPGRVPQEQNQLLQSRGWTTAITQGSAAALTDQLMSNLPGYASRTATATLGWNGPYLSSPIGTDPWNNRYLVNIGLIDTSQGLVSANGGPKAAVWVISAGPNGIIETPFNQPVTSASLPGGDDVGARLQ